MKNLLIIFLTIFSFHFANAQTETKIPTRQFGFDGAGFLARFLNFSGSGNVSTSNYYVTYRKFKGEKNARYGFGASLSLEGNGDNGTNTANAISFRGGSERFHDFGKTMGYTTRWRAFYGTDAKVFVVFNAAGSFDNSTTGISVGPAPFFGLQCRLNERLSFSTEMAYIFFLNFRDNNGESRFGFTTRFDPPTALYVNYDF